MRQIRIFPLLVSICVLGMAVWGAAAGASESNPEWQITKGGVKQFLGAGESETLAQAITTKKGWVLKQTAGTGVAVECSALKFNAAESSRITGPQKFTSGAVLFEGCKVTAPAGDTSCSVSSSGFPAGQIRTQALGFSAAEGLEGSTLTPRIRWRPVSTREEIVTFILEGTSCANKGTSYEVAGLLVGNVDSSAQKKAHLWTFAKNTGTRLTIGGVEAEFAGAGEFTLKSGNEWGDA